MIRVVDHREGIWKGMNYQEGCSQKMTGVPLEEFLNSIDGEIIGVMFITSGYDSGYGSWAVHRVVYRD